MKKSPSQGGCWFCHDDSIVEKGFLVFDDEFDTFVHLPCIKEQLKKDPKHPEAELMVYLLEDYDQKA